MEVVGHQFDFEYRYPGVATLAVLARGRDALCRSASRCAILRLLGRRAAPVLGPRVPRQARRRAGARAGHELHAPAGPARSTSRARSIAASSTVRCRAKSSSSRQADFNKWLVGAEGHAGCRPHRFARASGDAGRRQDAVRGEVRGVPRGRAVRPEDRRAGLEAPDRRPGAPEARDGQAADARQHRRDPRQRLHRSDRRMPNRQANGLSDTDIANLVAYLISLK